MERALNNIDRRVAQPMFALAVLFLLLLAGTLHLGHSSDHAKLSHAGTICLIGLTLLYPLFLLEVVFRWWAGALRGKMWWLYAIFPPLRMGAKDVSNGEQLWLPLYGWVHVNETLEQQIEKKFSLPMILIALAVLPVMGVEHYYAEKVAGNQIFAFSLQLATAMIWLAFTLEFLLMISIVQQKFQYCKEHWIDILVILLPLVSFLRFLRLARAGRMGRLTRLLKLQQLTKTARIYRLRGTMLRAYRAVLLLNVLGRLFRSSPEARLEQLSAELEEKELELAELRKQVWYAKNQCMQHVSAVSSKISTVMLNAEQINAEQINAEPPQQRKKTA